MGRKRLPKARTGFYKRGIPVKWENSLSYKHILSFQQKFHFYKVISRLTEALTLPGCFFFI